MDNSIESHVPLTVLAPVSLDSLRPLEIIDPTSAVKAAFVERYGIEHLPAEWSGTCGFYILFSHIREGHRFDAYVGKATNGFYRRLKEHNERKDYWDTAVLVQRDTALGLTSTQASYLEGAMRDILNSSPNVTVHNIAATGDRTLPAYEQPLMDIIVLSVLRIMFLRGYRNAHMGAIADRLAGLKTVITATEEVNGGRNPLNASEALKTPSSTLFPSGLDEEGKQACFNELRAWRISQAKSEGLSPAYIFSNSVLWAFIEAAPLTTDDLLKVSGIGPAKAEKYGEAMLTILSLQLLKTTS